MEETMSTYDQMRHFADSWGLVGITLFFAVVVVRVFLPGMKKPAQDAANIPFKDYPDEDK